MSIDFIKILSDYFQEAAAYQNVAMIHSKDRFISYDKFAESATFCENAMRESGLEEVERLELKADGVTVYGDQMVPEAWCARSATLRFPDGEVLCDYQKEPCSLSMYSAATPPGGITAEVVVVDDLEHLPADKDLQGKLMLVRTGAAVAAEIAVSVGAVGILHDFFPLFPGIRNSREEMRGKHRWDCLFSRKPNLFAFSLTPEQGDRLRELSESGTVTLHAEVDAGDSEGSLAIVSGAIRGRSPELPEVILYGHLYEPGANDNASGCGGLLELGRSMTEAIAQGVLNRPEHTIRFVVGPEYWGSAGYIYHHPKRSRLALIAADMVGNEQADRAHMHITMDPLSNRSYVDAAMVLANHRYAGFSGTPHRCDLRPYGAGSDNYVADPSLETPAVCFGNMAQSYHTSMDTMERIEADVLKRNILIVGDAAYMLANADERICDMLAEELKRQSVELEKQYASEKGKWLCQETYIRSIKSLKRLQPDWDSEKYIESDERIGNLWKWIDLCEALPAYVLDAGAEKIPIRLVKGPLFFAAHPELSLLEELRLDRETPLQWTNGQRTVWEIALRTAVEKKKDSEETVKELVKQYVRMFEILAEAGYTEWKQ